MDLGHKNRFYIVCGATSGFGLSVAKQLISEGANVMAVARTEKKLEELKDEFKDNIEIFAGDITRSSVIKEINQKTLGRTIDGILVNSGGPPAMSFQETKLENWDDAYQQLLRWKIELVKTFLPEMQKRKYGRFLFIESSAVKQPIENLVLSTSLRLAVVGFVKTLSQEIPLSGITFNIIAPAYHYTPAVERLVRKKSENEKISFDEARKLMEDAMPMKRTGNVDDFASLALWLLSPLSAYVTGQVYAVDGGVLKSTL